MDPLALFATDHYQCHNSRRLEHLATLGLDLAGRKVLEVSAGIGDHTSFFIDRGCRVTALEGRLENVEILKARFPSVETLWLDLDDEETSDLERFEIDRAGRVATIVMGQRGLRQTPLIPIGPLAPETD